MPHPEVSKECEQGFVVTTEHTCEFCDEKAKKEEPT
jgi:hypothetical protein